MKALKILFFILLFPPIAAIVGAGIGAVIGYQFSCDLEYWWEEESCQLAYLADGAVYGLGVGLVVYLTWGISYLLPTRGEKGLRKDAS